MASLLQELKRRNVIRVAVGYLVLAWVVLQITDLVAPALLLPEWTLSFVTFIGIIGFPFALFFAWIFELTPDGLKRSDEVQPAESITSHTGNHLNKIIITLLCIAVGILLADRFFGLSDKLVGADAQTVAEAKDEPANEPLAEAIEPNAPRSIAVLPFVNMSDDKEQEYFSDGISEELLNALAQIRELRVAARTSSFAFKGKNQDITDIGEQLNVETVLEGSVRKSGAKVRITAQLINVEDGYHLWSNTYDRDLTDIFAVQDEISAAIVDALKVHLTGEEEVRHSKEIDIAAYNFYLQARHNVRLRTKESLELALRQYQQALEIDEKYAAAWAGKALATSLLREDQYGDIPADDATEQAQDYLDVAFAIDPGIGTGHAAQALVHMDQGDCTATLQSLEKAIAATPTEGVLHMWQSMCLDELGEYRASDQALERAYSIDPLHRAVRINWVDHLVLRGEIATVREMATPGTAEYYDIEWAIARSEGRWADMYQIMQASRALNPTNPTQRRLGTTLYFWLGEAERGLEMLPPIFEKYDQALRAPAPIIAEFSQRDPQALSDLDRDLLLDALEAAGDWREIERVVSHLNLEERTDFGNVSTGAGVFSNASSLMVALYGLGEQERSRRLAGRLKSHLDRSLDNGLPYIDYVGSLGFVEFYLGNPAAAVQAWWRLNELHGLPPVYIHTGNSAGREMMARDDMQALVQDIQRKMNEQRAKLGWDPKPLMDT